MKKTIRQQNPTPPPKFLLKYWTLGQFLDLKNQEGWTSVGVCSKCRCSQGPSRSQTGNWAEIESIVYQSSICIAQPFLRWLAYQRSYHLKRIDSFSSQKMSNANISSASGGISCLPAPPYAGILSGLSWLRSCV